MAVGVAVSDAVGAGVELLPLPTQLVSTAVNAKSTKQDFAGLLSRRIKLPPTLYAAMPFHMLYFPRASSITAANARNAFIAKDKPTISIYQYHQFDEFLAWKGGHYGCSFLTAFTYLNMRGRLRQDQYFEHKAVPYQATQHHEYVQLPLNVETAAT